MFLPSLAQAGWPALFACTALACAKTPPTPDAFVSAVVGGGNACSTLGPSTIFVQIGSTANPAAPSTVPDGTGPVSVSCTVAPSGSGFTVQLGASATGGGKIQITGHVDGSGGTVHGSFVNNTYGAFDSDSCTVTYKVLGNQGTVSAGLIYAHIACPGAQSNSGQQNADGTNVACDASADFIFSNCADGS